jgi:hypothetical protein
MSSTARPVEPTAPDAAATGRAYDDAQVKKTDQALSAWRESFERHHEEQLALEAERLAHKPPLAPWFLAAASGVSLLVAMVAVVARVVAPPSNVTAVSVAPLEESTGVAAAEVQAPITEPTALPAAPPPVEGEAGTAPAAPQLEIVGTPRTWESSGYHWVSFEAKTDAPLRLSWLDANGEPALDERTCGFSVGDGKRRCRVGRSEGRIGAALAAGAAPGAWRIQACSDTGCADVATIAVDR